MRNSSFRKATLYISVPLLLPWCHILTHFGHARNAIFHGLSLFAANRIEVIFSVCSSHPILVFLPLCLPLDLFPFIMRVKTMSSSSFLLIMSSKNVIISNFPYIFLCNVHAFAMYSIADHTYVLLSPFFMSIHVKAAFILPNTHFAIAILFFIYFLHRQSSRSYDASQIIEISHLVLRFTLQIYPQSWSYLL